MISSHVASNYSDIRLSHIDWKYYNKIKKKAMEQEFSWSGLVLSLSIAFFIVILAAFFLSNFYSFLQINQSSILDLRGTGIYFESVQNTELDSSLYLSKYI